MTIRQSTGTRDRLLAGMGFSHIFEGGELRIYSGAQPASADDAPAGTLLVTITAASGARTVETATTGGTITLNTGAAGSVDTVKVNGVDVLDAAVPFNTSLTQTAADVVTAINRSSLNKLVDATSAAAVITLTARPGIGGFSDGWTVVSTATTITKTDANFHATDGVSAVNGLKFDAPATGTLAKRAGQTWSGVVAVTGTAGWARLVGPRTDAGGSSATLPRLDMSVAASGGDLNLTSTSLTATATETITTFSPTELAS